MAVTTKPSHLAYVGYNIVSTSLLRHFHRSLLFLLEEKENNVDSNCLIIHRIAVKQSHQMLLPAAAMRFAKPEVLYQIWFIFAEQTKTQAQALA